MKKIYLNKAGFVVALLSFILVSAVMFFEGNKQNEEFFSDFQKFQESLMLMEMEEYSKSEKILKELLSRGKNSRNYYINWSYAVCLSGQDKVTEAALFFDNALKIRPLLFQNDIFVLQYAETLYNANNLEKSKVYFNLIANYSNNKEYVDIAQQRINEIGIKKEGIK